MRRPSKALYAIGALLLIVSLVAIIASLGGTSPAHPLWTLGVVVGAIMYALGRFLVWWQKE